MTDVDGMQDEDALPPDPVARDPFQLRGEAPRVMRLSRKALACLGLLAGLSIGGALLYALRPHIPRVAQNLYESAGKTQADVVTAAPSDYTKVPRLGPPLPGDLGPPLLSAAQRAGGAPAPGPSAPGADRRQHEADARAAARASALFTTAGQHGDLPAIAGTTAAALPVAASATASPGGPTMAPATPAAAQRAFLAARPDAAMASDARLRAAPSPDILQAGSIIPAALITAVRSDLPGEITAQVTENVYDSPTGRILLIPQGTRLIGNYDSALVQGQSRLLLAWDRLIWPDGRSLTLDRLPGTDASGQTGLQDKTNMHWGNMLKAVLLSSVLGVGTGLVTNDEGALVQALRYGVQDTANQSGQQLVQRELAVAPTLTIRPGFALNVLVTRDLIIDPTTEAE